LLENDVMLTVLVRSLVSGSAMVFFVIQNKRIITITARPDLVPL